MNEKIIKAAKILNQGGIVIFPTDTAFAIGCKISEEKAVERLYEIRKRPGSQPSPVLVDGIKMASKYLISIPDKVKKELMEKYWPGPLTIVLPCKTEKVPSVIRGGGSTLGVRESDSEIVSNLISLCSVPLVGTSANLKGEKTPFLLEELDEKLIRQVDFVVDIEACKGNKSSTVIDCSVEPWRIIREGATKI